MDAQTNQEFRTLTAWGKILLESANPRLEAFSGNALYCGRGMPTMSKLKTVKEVCSATGLTGKHLYYFHHENIVRASAYANYSVEGNDGYKLYDDASVEKLQLIALCYQIGLKRNEISKLVQQANFDGTKVLDQLLRIEQTRKAHAERHIAALEHLQKTGIENGLPSILRGISLEELGRTIIAVRNSTSLDTDATDRFMLLIKEIQPLIAALSTLDEATLYAPLGDETIGKLFELGTQFCGADGCPFLLGLLASSISESASEITKPLSPVQRKAVIHYLAQHPELYAPTVQRDPV